MGIHLDANRVRQLGIKAGQVVLVLNAPSGFADGLGRAAQDACVVTALAEREQPNVVVFWPEKTDDLEEEFRRLRRAIRPEGAIWAVLRKKSAARGRAGPDWREVQNAGLSAGLVDNKTLSLSEEDYGTRFVVPLAERLRLRRSPYSRD